MTIVDARVPTRAPGLELLGELRDSGYTESRSIVRRADGQIVQLTALLYGLLEAVDGRRDTTALAEELSRSSGKSIEVEDVEFLLHERLAPLGLVCDADGNAPAAGKSIPLLALRWKVVVTEPRLTRRLTAPFAALFRTAIVVPVVVAFAATAWWVLFRHGLAGGTRQAFDSPGLLLAAFLLILVSAGWHEFGHAAACRAAGATPGAMGAGLYMVWPAFYTDVDDSRRLSRWGRLKVDLGGIYFNMVAAVAVMAVWLVARVDALLLVVAAQLLLIVRQLAPVIRADGYHILSDLVGVPDLFQHMKPTLAGMLPQNWGKPQPLRPWARWTVRAWVLLVAPLLFLLLLSAVLLFPRLLATAWMGLTRQWSAMTSSGTDVLGVAAALLKMASLLLPVAGVTYMVVRFTRRTAGKAWRSTEDRPVARALVMTLTMLLAFFLAFAWWPAGQYEPVRADEVGTITNALHLRDAPAASPAQSAQPVAGYALIARDGGDAPTLLVVPGEDGALQAIVTEGDQAGLAFPFTLPDAPGAGDNQSLAVNTTVGGVVYDVAVALVWVTDGSAVENRNEAYALASCAFCRTVAVSFQVVLVVGQTDVVAPVNIAVAANGGCLACQTTALAVQLVVTLAELPDDDLQARIESAMASLDDLDLDDMNAVYAEITAVENEVLTMLDEAGLVTDTAASESTSSESTTTTTTSSSSSTTSESTTTTTADDGASTTTSTTNTSTTTTTQPDTTDTTSP